MITSFIRLANNFGIIPKSKFGQMVNGLRDSEPPSEIKVYRANPDGSRGEFLRAESPPVYPYSRIRSKS